MDMEDRLVFPRVAAGGTGSLGLVDAKSYLWNVKKWGPTVAHRNYVQSLGLEHDAR